MLTLAGVFYVFTCWISNWNLLWPITLWRLGDVGDRLIVIVWVIILIIGLC